MRGYVLDPRHLCGAQRYFQHADERGAGDLQGAAMNNEKRYEYDAVLHEQDDNGGAYVIFPWDIREEFGMGRVKVHALFDGIPYDGSIVNMGVKNPDGSVCYIIGVLKAIRNKLNKHDGDTIHVVIVEKEKQN